MSTTPLLQVDAVTRDFPSPTGPLSILRGVSFTLHRGQTLAVTGPSGSGKSTLLNLIASLDRPTSGSILVEGRRIADLAGPSLQQYRATTIGLVFQDHRLFPQLTATENILVPTLAAGCRQNQSRADELLEAMGLSARANSYAWQLSGGERQRIAIARALINGASLLLCDEPTGNLDHANANAIADLLVCLAPTRHIATIIVTHNPTLASRCSSRLRLDSGHLAPE